MTRELEYDDIQSLILFAHGHLTAARFLFVRADGSREAFRTWLASIAEEVSTSPRGGKRSERAVHIAFAASGLTALGLPARAMLTFLQEFRDGMADTARARSLGDVHGSAPQHWDWGAGDPARQPHLVLMLYALDAAALAPLLAEHRRRLDGARLTVVAEQGTLLRPDSREPFGFVDGIAQPQIEGMHRREPDGSPRHSPADPDAATSTEPVVKAGEFILGYRNAYGGLPFSPHLPATPAHAGRLDPVEQRPDLLDLGKNGTYLVIRKLEQDVKGFHAFIDEHAVDPRTGQPDRARATWLAAKLMGRWPDGAPVTRARDADSPAYAEPGRRNAFDYRDDMEGLGCPLSAHVRRANPRASLPADSAEQSLGLVARHRIIRRGRPYTEERRTDAETATAEGVLFLAINANIARQFEFIQQSWINNPSFGGLDGARDPICGANHQPGERAPRESFAAVVPADPFRIRLGGLARFVHTRGGGYFFMPGRKALRFLATADYASPPAAGGGEPPAGGSD
jgi:Dyp-type peroxidase family